MVEGGRDRDVDIETGKKPNAEQEPMIQSHTGRERERGQEKERERERERGFLLLLPVPKLAW